MIDFEKKNWYDASDVANRIPISPSNLNRIEDGIEKSVNAINLMEPDLYNHWWRKSKIIGGEVGELGTSSTKYFYLWDTNTQTSTVYYADSITVKLDEGTGELYAELENYKSMTLSYKGITVDRDSTLQNKFFMLDAPSGKNLYYTTGFCSKTYDSSAEHIYGFYVTTTYDVRLVKSYGDIEYVNSADINAYLNGWSDTDVAFYEYLGIPCENSRKSCGVVTGWYYGDGKAQRLIKTELKPKCVFLYVQNGNVSYLVNYAPYCYALATETFSFGSATLSDEGFVVKTTDASVNSVGVRYGYIVFY